MPYLHSIKPILLLMLGCLLYQCSYDEKWQTATTKTSDQSRSFSLTMPPYMEAEAARKLNPTAQLQYCNYYRNVYAVVLDEAKSKSNDSTLQQYADRYLNDMVKTLIKPQRIDSAAIELANMKGLTITLTGDLGQLKDLRERIYYRLAFVESPTHYYQVATWTWDSRRKNFAADLDSILYSFKEID
jgi:hypothetical protein